MARQATHALSDIVGDISQQVEEMKQAQRRRRHEAARKAHQRNSREQKLRESRGALQSELRNLQQMITANNLFLAAELKGRADDVQFVLQLIDDEKCFDAFELDKDTSEMPAVTDSASHALMEKMAERLSAVERNLQVDDQQLQTLREMFQSYSEEWITQLNELMVLVRTEGKRRRDAAKKAHQDEREKKLRESELRNLQQIRSATNDCFLAELEGRTNDLKCLKEIYDEQSPDRDGMPAVDESALCAVLQRMTERHSAVDLDLDLKQLSINNKEWIPQLTAMKEVVRLEKKRRRDAAEEAHGSVELELELEEDAVQEADGRRNRGSIPLALYSEQDMRDLRQSHDVERQTWEDRRNELERINEANNQELMRLRREVQQLRAQASLLAAPEFVPDPPTHAQPQPQPQHRSRPSQIVDEETKHDITDVPVGNGLMHGVYVAQPMVYSSHAQPHMPPESIVPMPIANSQYYPPHGHGQLQLQATQNMGMGVDMEHERLKQQRLVQEAEAVKDCLDADEDSKTDICWHFNEWDGDCYDPNCTWRHRYFVEDVYNEVGDELYKGIIKRYVFTQGRCMSDPRLLQENALTDAETADLQNLYGGQAIAAPSHSQPRDRRASVAPVYHAYHGQ